MEVAERIVNDAGRFLSATSLDLSRAWLSRHAFTHSGYTGSQAVSSQSSVSNVQLYDEQRLKLIPAAWHRQIYSRSR